MPKKVVKRTNKPEVKKEEPNGRTATTVIQDDVVQDNLTDLIAEAVQEEMPEWLQGFDSPGPTPRDAGYYRLLAKLGERGGLMLDLGTAEGVSAMCMAKAGKAQVLSVGNDLSKIDPRCKLEGIGFVEGDALTFVREALDEVPDVVFLDLDSEAGYDDQIIHMLAGCMQKKGSLIIVDDVTWPKIRGYAEWWSALSYPGWEKVTVIDLHSRENAGLGILVRI